MASARASEDPSNRDSMGYSTATAVARVNAHLYNAGFVRKGEPAICFPMLSHPTPEPAVLAAAVLASGIGVDLGEIK
ncbi:hypothetical protein QE152_g27030 [Popillia japonica]|uniref:Uncharacterized protein n=1 Tax=Popillia japonica TaxID=7064 RepID=A0AAW1JUX1_POPJA